MKFVIEPVFFRYVKHRAAGACLGVHGPDIKVVQAGPYHGAGCTWRTALRLHRGRIQSAASLPGSVQPAGLQSSRHGPSGPWRFRVRLCPPGDNLSTFTITAPMGNLPQRESLLRLWPASFINLFIHSTMLPQFIVGFNSFLYQNLCIPVQHLSQKIKNAAVPS